MHQLCRAFVLAKRIAAGLIQIGQPLVLKQQKQESLTCFIRFYLTVLPGTRANARTFLARCGLSFNRPMRIISVSKGLSLNDSYWVVDENFKGTFQQYNLYENRFSRILALIAFTGYGSSIRSSLASSPEFTTNGMLPKCWRRISGKIFLYKGGTSGASNAGNEPFSEFYAYQGKGHGDQCCSIRTVKV